MIEIPTYQSKTFKDIFADYDTFKSWYTENSGLSDDETDVPAKKTFSLIFNQYADCHIAFTEDGFKNHFANDIYTYYKEFEATTSAIDDLMKLADDDISISGAVVQNIADVPETTSSTDVESVDFLGNQTKTFNKKGTLQIKREQLSNKRTYTTKTFLGRFRHLFIRIISPSFNILYGEEE